MDDYLLSIFEGPYAWLAWTTTILLAGAAIAEAVGWVRRG